MLRLPAWKARAGCPASAEALRGRALPSVLPPMLRAPNQENRMQSPRTLTAALLGVALAFGVSAALAQTTVAPADGQASDNPTQRTDAPSSNADRTAKKPKAGVETSSAGGDMKPHTKKHRHKKSTDATSAGDMSHSGAQSGGNDAATGMGNAQSGSSKPAQ
ncbi:hypothetical protein [Ralstonia solanacearum]|uniref:hypothetical protein n=2 Tax=Ralstonia solanacearum TaxID=305 RepID=UPI001E5AD79B|nr:hypothetical protein [Ralstonia solanacearum]